MAQFTLNWDNTDILSSSNNLSQIASYRQKSVGGSWISSGFSPTNPMTKSIASAQTPVITSNIVYEFKVDCTCTQGGPVQNDNGIIENIGFACIVPTIENTDTTSVVTINLAGTDITKVTFTLRKSSDNTVKHGPITVNRIGTIASTVASGLVASTGYYWQITLIASVNGLEINSGLPNYLNSVCGPYTLTTDSAPIQDLQWIANTSTCESEGGFSVSKLITGLSSPANVWYDPVNSLVYVADNDDINGNVYWFNPNTATTYADMIHSSQVMDQNLYQSFIDPIYRKIYFIGKNSNGLIVYDIDTNTKTTVVFGSNGTNYNRISLTVTATRIYVRHDIDQTFTILNRSTRAIISTVNIADIPNNTRFSGGSALVSVGTELWAVAGSGSSVSTVGVYNQDLTSNITNITLTGAAIWDNALYWQLGFHDPVGNKVYISDIGSNKRFVIDATSRTVVNARVIGNREGKSNVLLNWTINPINNELLAIFAGLNSSLDGSPIQRMYPEDRTSYLYTNMFENQSYSGLSQITGTNKVVGCDPGVSFPTGIGTYNVDGKTTILSNSIGGINTGRKIILTLKEVDANNGNSPTGNVKDNLVGDPDYIAPVTSSDCSVTYTTTCPADKATSFVGTTLEYEFAILNSVKNNPSIAKIEVYAYNTNTSSVEGTPTTINAPFTTNYYSGSFTGLGGSNYTIQIRYKNSSDVILQTC
jgi:hypothetical protein